MKIEIIQRMIDNSTWKSSNKNNIYEFQNGKDLSINGLNHQEYKLEHVENKIVLQLGSSGSYFVEYINDFILNLYNESEKFRIMPD